MVFVPAFVVAGLTMSLAAQGALAASFAVSGTSFKLAADSLDGTGFVSYGAVDTGADGAHHPVTPGGFRSAQLKNLCQSVVTPSPFGPVTMRLTAGGTTPVKATNMVADFDQLQGDITFNGYASGMDASQVSGGPSTGARGQWGQQAKTIHIANLRQRAWSTTAATFILSGLTIKVSFGTHECF